MKRSLIVLLMVVTAAASGARATTWHVNPLGTGDAPTIQAAVNAAASGDVILIEPGVYRETDILIDGKNLMIDQTTATAILMSPVAGSGTGMIIRNTTGAFTLNSLTFRGYAAAVAVESGSPMVNWITIKAGGKGLVVSGATAAPLVSYSLIDSCATGIEVQSGGSFSLRNETIVNCATGALFAGGNPTLEWSIIAMCGTGIQCAGSTTLTCNNLWGNTADYSGCAPGSTDFMSDPIFCLLTPPSPGLYYLHDTSPCWTASNPCSRKIGAFVSRVGCTGTAVEETTWGAIKAFYR